VNIQTKIWIVLYLVKIIPLSYGYLYEIFKKLPYPDFLEALTMLILMPPVFISELPGMSWLSKSSFDPSIWGIIVSLILWAVVDVGLAYVISKGIKLFYA
jgi:hypothetical protein